MPSTNVMMTLGTCDQFFIQNFKSEGSTLTPENVEKDGMSYRNRSDSLASNMSTISRVGAPRPEKRAFAFFVWSPEKKQTYGAYAHLGVTLTLRGETQEKLLQVKQMLKHLLRTAFNLQLEADLLANEGGKVSELDPASYPCGAFALSPHIGRFGTPELLEQLTYGGSELGAHLQEGLTAILILILIPTLIPTIEERKDRRSDSRQRITLILSHPLSSGRYK